MATQIHAPTLSNFSAEVRNRNVSRGNLYYVQILEPRPSQYDRSGITDTGHQYGEVNERLVSTWCAGASTPMTYIHTQDNYTENGIRRKYATDYDHANLILHFYIDQDYSIKKFFDDWMRKIVPNRRNFNYPKDYTVDKLSLFIINMEDTATYQYDYSRVFPKHLSQIDLSATNSELSTFSVEFVYETFNYISHGKNGNQVSSLPDEIKTVTSTIDNNPSITQHYPNYD